MDLRHRRRPGTDTSVNAARLIRPRFPERRSGQFPSPRPSAVSCCEMKSQINLRRMGLRKFSPLRGDHPEIGALCFLCKRPIQAGDEICRVPQGPDGRESDTLVAHWTCVEIGFIRLRGSGSVASGDTRDSSNPGPKQ